MTVPDELGAIARAIIGSSLYMVVATSDEAGTPWATPVYYAHQSYTRFLWVSSPQTRHSRNLAARPRAGIAIFDSGAAISTGQGVYMSADAEELAEAEVEHALGVYSERSLLHGGRPFRTEDVREPAALRLWRATATAQWVLEPGAPTDRRVPVDLRGEGRT